MNGISTIFSYCDLSNIFLDRVHLPVIWCYFSIHVLVRALIYAKLWKELTILHFRFRNILKQIIFTQTINFFNKKTFYCLLVLYLAKRFEPKEPYNYFWERKYMNIPEYVQILFIYIQEKNIFGIVHNINYHSSILSFIFVE